VLVDQNDTGKNATADLEVTFALFLMVEGAGHKRVPFGLALVTQSFKLMGFPTSQRQPAFYNFDLNVFEIGAGQSYAMGSN